MRSNSFKNHILSAISLEDWNGERNTLFSDLESVKLAQRQVLSFWQRNCSGAIGGRNHRH